MQAPKPDRRSRGRVARPGCLPLLRSLPAREASGANPPSPANLGPLAPLGQEHRWMEAASIIVVVAAPLPPVRTSPRARNWVRTPCAPWGSGAVDRPCVHQVWGRYRVPSLLRAQPMPLVRSFPPCERKMLHTVRLGAGDGRPGPNANWSISRPKSATTLTSSLLRPGVARARLLEL